MKKLYTKTHEWVKIDGGKALVGISDHAQQALGGIVFVELPNEGAKVAEGGELATVESVKSVSTVYSPVAGTVAEVNSALLDKPELLNEDAGTWIVKLDVSSPDESRLMDEKEYERFCLEEEH